MGEKRTLEARVQEKEKQIKRALEKAEQYKNQLKQLQNRKADEERKQRTHKLIVAGAELAALYERVLEVDEVHELIHFLRQQKETGRFDVVKRENPIKEEKAEAQEETKEQENNFDFGGLFNF